MFRASRHAIRRVKRRYSCESCGRFECFTAAAEFGYRRKTNTYAKKKKGLQRTLDVFWVIHNFIRKHFTTQRVPAVALGILKKGLSWEQVLKIQQLPIFSI